MRKNLVKAFDKAGLRLELLKEPIRSGTGMADIVQLDVGRNLRGNGRTEWFRLWPGHENNNIQVRDADKKNKQVVLLVNEPTREFEEKVPIRKAWGKGRSLSPTRDEIKQDLGSGERILRRNKEEWVVLRKTSADTRYFLMGVDERQLFIAQLAEPCTTVAQAHFSLSRTVLTADGKRKGSALDRQGEWFFWETDQRARETIDEEIAKNRLVVHKKVPIGSFAARGGGNPHTVDELVVIPAINKLAHGFGVRPRSVYVRGKVRHVDHKTIKFSHWREVVANNEGATARATASGVYWVD